MNKKILISIGILIFILIGGYWLRNDLSVSKIQNNNIEAIRLGSSLQPLSSLVFIAQENNFFEDQNLDIEIFNYDSGADTINDLVTDKIDLALMTDFAFVNQVLGGKDFVTVGSLSKSDMQELVTTKNSGINNLDDLRGKKVALKKNSSSEFWLSRSLLFNGLMEDDIEKVYIEVAEMPTALQDKKSDAVITWQPHVEKIKQALGDQALSWSAQNNQDLHWLIVGKRKFIENNQNKIQKILLSFIQAEDFYKSDRVEADNIIKKYLEVDDNFLSKVVYNKFDFNLGLDQSLILVAEDMGRWLIKNKYQDVKMLNFLNYIYIDALEAVNPREVTIIH